VLCVCAMSQSKLYRLMTAGEFPPVTTQIHSDVTAPSARSKSKALSAEIASSSRRLRVAPRRSPLSIDAQTVYYGRPFAVVGQLPAPQQGQESEGIVGCALHMKKGARL
jgi:hypothetical protein